MEPTLACALLADPHHGLTEGVRSLLGTLFEAVVMVTDRTSLFEAAGRLEPRVAVVDLRIAGRDVAEFLRDVRERCPELRVIFLSVHDEAAVADAVLGAGADGFVVKRNIATDLLPAVDSVLTSARCRA